MSTSNSPTPPPTPRGNNEPAASNARPRAAASRSRSASSLEAPSLITPLAVLHALRRRWKPAVAVAVPCAVIAALIASASVPANYTAFALLRISANEPRLVFDTAESKSDFNTYRQTQVALITSRFVLNAALRKPGVADLSMVREQQFVLPWLESQLEVTTKNSPEMLRIALSGDRPDELAAIVNAVKDAYLEEVVHAERKDRLTRLSDLERIFQETDEKVRQKQSRAEKLAKQLGTGDSKALTIKQQMALEYFSQLQREYSRVRFDLMREQLDDATGVPAGPISPTDELLRLPAGVELPPNAASTPETAVAARRIVQLRDLITRYEKQVVDKRTPALVEYRRQLRDLETWLADRAAAPEASVDPLSPAPGRRRPTRHDVLQRQEQLLREEVEKYATLVETIGTSSFELESMQTELGQITKVADRVGQEIEALRIELQSPPRVVLLQSAEVPQKRDLGRKTKLTGLAAIGTLGLILVCFTLLELRAQRLATPDEVSEALGIPVLGTVPAVGRPLDRTSDELLLRELRIGDAADALRAVLLRWADRDIPPAKALLVASAASGEGKTSTACELARSFARAGRRTLLVDCDLRKPAVHARLGIPNRIGLCEALRGEVTWSDAVVNVGPHGLDVLTAGRCSDAALHALARAEGGRLFDELRREYDEVLIDAAPLLAVPDAASLARQVDGALLVVRRDVSRRPHAIAARERLAALGIPIAGAVMIGVDCPVDAHAYATPAGLAPVET